ncbi:MAG: glycosyltransferase family 9 protein [Verrucomicrobia bacterium]|nr:glycosyltransferase family 9 protein [Verrucomicrobiota bacterium]
MSSAVIAEIRAKFPGCKIGFLVSKKSKVVLETCPPVDWVHEIHSWFVPGQPYWKNCLNYVHFLFTQQRQLAKELAQIKYDAAIELRPFIPNIIPLFWKARIPVRIGFSSSGNSGLLNLPVEWNCQEYLPYCYPSLLEKIEISLNDREKILPKISPKKDKPLIAGKPYLIFHLCSSDDRKELPIEFWNSLKLKCHSAGYSVYFTGMGNREKEIIDKVADNPSFNLCNRLDWDQLVHHIQQAQGIVSVDSVPIHLAATFDVPTAAIFRSTNFSNLWKPDRPTTHIFDFQDGNLVENVFDVIKKWIPTPS